MFRKLEKLTQKTPKLKIKKEINLLTTNINRLDASNYLE